jgi:Uma2 family endonuclease
MGATTSTPLLTFEEFERLPDTPGKYELLEGEVIELPVPEYSHSIKAQDLLMALLAALSAAHGRGDSADLGNAHMEMGFKPSSRSYVRPDVSITHAGQLVDRFLQGAPAIAIEIISPSNTVEEMDVKTRLYFKHGAKEVWRIHPKGRYIAVHLAGSITQFSENAILTTPLLPGFALSVREILGA